MHECAIVIYHSVRLIPLLSFDPFRAMRTLYTANWKVKNIFFTLFVFMFVRRFFTAAAVAVVRVTIGI